MAQKNSGAKFPTAGADYDAVVAQMGALRDAVAKLAGPISLVADHRSKALATGVSDGIAEAVRYLGRWTRETEAKFEGAVATHPIVAISMAAGFGLLLGVLTRR